MGKYDAYPPYLTDPKKSLTPRLPLGGRFGWGLWKDGHTYCEYCKMYAPKKIQDDYGWSVLNPAAHEGYGSEFCTSKEAIVWKKKVYAELDKKAKEAKKRAKAKLKRSEKMKKAFMSDEKERKIAAFNNRIFQSGHRSPSISKKELAWNDTGGRCKSCRRYKIVHGLGFWWRIYPTLEVALLCRDCAEKEGLSVVHNEEIVKSRRITEEVMDSVWNRDGGKCVHCGSNEKLEFDHIIPFSKGGANTKRNIQLLCEPCNRSKSDSIG